MKTQTLPDCFRLRHRFPPGLPPKKPRRGWAGVIVLALAAALVFCHGCHSGDHDDEPGVFLFKARPAPADDKTTR